MTINVSGPDGSTFSFPDGTPQAEISTALDSHYGAKEAAPAVAAPAAPIGDNRAATVAALRGIPIAGAYADKGAAYLNALAQKIGIDPGEGMAHSGTISEMAAANEPVIKAAVDQREKEHPIESTVGKIAAGTGALAPLGAIAPVARALGVGGEALLPSMIKGGLTAGAIGGTDAAVRGEDIGKGAMYGAGGGVVGPLAGKAIGGAVEGIANKSAQTPAVNDLAQAAQRLKVDLPRVAASDSLVTQRTGAALKELPVLGDPIVKASRAADEQMGNALKNVEQGYGSGSTLNAGDVAKTGLTDWITGGSKNVASRLYGNVDSLVNPAITQDLASTRNMIANIAAERQQAGLPGSSKAIDSVIEAVQRPGGLNYEGVKTLRTSIGEMMDNSVLPADIRRSELKRIYGSLTSDLKNTVSAAGGPDAVKAFDKANTINTLISQRRESLAKIVGDSADASPERVMDRLIGFAGGNSRADFNKLALARKTIGGNNWDEIASAAVSKIGRDADGNFSPARFLTGYGKLSPLGKQTLFGSTGKTDLVQALEDIATLSRRAGELQKFANPSGTGRVMGGLTTVGAALTQPHVVLPAAMGARMLATQLAKPLRVKPTTLAVAARNANVRALIEHVVGRAAIGAVPAASGAPAIPLPRTSAPALQAIQ